MLSRKLITVSVLVLSATFANVSVAAPGFGTLFGKGASSNSFMSYSCVSQGNSLDCHMTQILLRRKLTEEAYESRYAEDYEHLVTEISEDGESKWLDDFCMGVESDIRPYVEALSGDDESILEDGVREALSQMPPGAQKETLNFFQKYIKLCEIRPANWMEKFIRISLDRELKTCSLITNPYEQTFIESDQDRFVSRRGPSGVCGVVTVGVFERAEDFASEYIYREERVITNRKGSSSLLSCSDLEDAPLEYDWKPTVQYKNCVLIGL